MLREDAIKRKEKQKFNEKKRRVGKQDEYIDIIFQLHIRKIKYFIIQLMHRNSASRYLWKTTLVFLVKVWYNIIIKKMIDYDKQQLIITPRKSRLYTLRVKQSSGTKWKSLPSKSCIVARETTIWLLSIIIILKKTN